MLEETLKPTTLKELFGRRTELKPVIDQIKKTGNIPHLALIGPQGTGKTLIAKLLAKAVLKEAFAMGYFFHNASEDFSVDFFRTQIIAEAKTKSIGSNMKILILDEFDGASAQAQAVLRSPMMEYADQTRFIITGNYKNKIIDPIISRCMEVDLRPFDKAEMMAYAEEMAKRAGVDIKGKAESIAMKAGGDCRKVLQLIASIQSGVAIDAPKDLMKMTETAFFEASFTTDPYMMMNSMYDEVITKGKKYDLITLFANANRDFGNTPFKEWVVQNLFHELKAKGVK